MQIMSLGITQKCSLSPKNINININEIIKKSKVYASAKNEWELIIIIKLHP